MAENVYIQTLKQEVETHARAARVMERAGQPETAAYFREGQQLAEYHLALALEGARTWEAIDKTPEWIRGDVKKMFEKGGSDGDATHSMQ